MTSGAPWPAAKRRKHFWNKRNRAGHSFSTEHVWTFSMFQHFVDMSKYELDMVYRFDLADKLDGQPLQFMCKDRCAVAEGPVAALARDLP